MALCAVTDRPLLASSFTEVMFRSISPAMRHALSVPQPPKVSDLKGWDAVYRNVRTRLHRLLGLMDPSPTPKNRRLAPDRFLLATERHRAAHSDEEWVRFGERLEWFINQLLETSFSVLQREVRRRWKGSVAVDATVVPAFARSERSNGAKGAKRKMLVHSADPDAAWYVRRDAEDTGSNGASYRRSLWAYEATIVVTGSDDPDVPGKFPTLVLGMAPLHQPGFDVGQNAMRAIASIHRRGHPANWLAADRAYTNAKPENFQLPARALEYRPVLDYKIDQLGIQDSYGGMLLVDGTWYCPSIPEVLINATLDFRNAKVDEATYRARSRSAGITRSSPSPDLTLRGMSGCAARRPIPGQWRAVS